MTHLPSETIYQLSKISPLGKTKGPAQSLRAVFTPSGPKGEWQMQIRAHRRGSRTGDVLLETSPACPLVSVTLGSETYALPIGWHERKRGGTLCMGGSRRTGTDGSVLQWEMRWTPDPAAPGRFTLELRARATPNRTGDLCVCLQTRLLAPEFWTLGAAAQGHSSCAQLVFSQQNAQAVTFTAAEADAGWDDDARCFRLRARRFPLGGSKCVRAQVAFVPAQNEAVPRAALLAQHVEASSARLHQAHGLPPLAPQPAADWLSDPAHYAAPGAERLYLRLPGADTNNVQSGAPHFPLDALHALSEWSRFHAHPDAARLVRYAAMGIAADCQVMGRAGEPEPNKGAFWDQMRAGQGCDFDGRPLHGIAANARIARALFLLHEATGERLLHQSALNICQWLLLKANADGGHNGAHVHATEGRATDGRVVPQPCALDSAEAIHPLVLAFRATRNEVFIKAAAKIAAALLPRVAEMEGHSPPAAASVARALLALNAEAPQAHLQVAIAVCGNQLRALPLCQSLPLLNADGRHSGLYECAQAGFALLAHTGDLAFLRYAFHALSLVPAQSRAANWREMASQQAAALSVAALLPGARIDFDRHTVSLDWRTYAPDPATEQHLQVQGNGDKAMWYLPLVCRASDQLLLLVVAATDVDAVTVLKNGRRPLACDLLRGGGTYDTDTPLHAPGGIGWARIGLFTIDP